MSPHKAFNSFGKKSDLLQEAETFSSCSFILCGHFDTSIVCLYISSDVSMETTKFHVGLTINQHFG